MPEVPTPRPDDRDALIRRQQEEIARLRDALTRAEHERDRLKRRNERLEDQLDAARRAGFRQAAPSMVGSPRNVNRADLGNPDC